MIFQKTTSIQFCFYWKTLVFCFSKETGVCGSKFDICLGE